MTEKMARESLHRIWFHFVRLQNALNHAHNIDLIKYEGYENGPCSQAYKLKEVIELTTQKQLADIIHREIRNKVWK